MFDYAICYVFFLVGCRVVFPQTIPLKTCSYLGLNDYQHIVYKLMIIINYYFVDRPTKVLFESTKTMTGFGKRIVLVMMLHESGF